MKSIWEKIKFEFSLLNSAAKIVLRVLFYIFILVIIYKITIPFIKYNLPKNLSNKEYENISGFIIIGLVFLSLIVSKYIEEIFKNQRK